MDPHESAARKAAARAGRILRERWLGRNPAELKSTSIDLVTDADRACEAAILEVLRDRFPDYAVLAEESGAAGEGESQWIVDPLDGTTNFAHSYPQFAVSIALRRRGRTVFALVHDPIREETFTAHRGGGSFCNRRPIRVSTASALATALLASGFPYDRQLHADFYLRYFKAFMIRTQGIRRAGSAALDLCWVACGRVDGFWEWRLKPWDTAAGALLVEEAGGRVADFAGGTFDPWGEQCLATNGALHDEMVAVLAPMLREREGTVG